MSRKNLRKQYHAVVAKMEVIRYESSLKAQLTYNRLQIEKEKIMFQLKYSH